VKFYSIDTFGNNEEAQDIQIIIDSVASDAIIDSAPSGTVAVYDATITFHSIETGSTFECSLDGAAPVTCTSPASYTGLADGAHTISVTATDAVGNVGTTPATASWTVDVTAPDTIIDSAPSGTVSATTASITFHSTEADSTFVCSLDGAAVDSCTSLASYTGLADGAHTFSVTATDAVGNVDATPATASWTIDATAPDTIIDSAPSGTVSATSASITFHSTEIGSTFECSLDGAAAASCTSPASYTGLSDGSHTFSVTATDAAGNTDATPATTSWTVDTTAPDTIIDSAPSGTVSATDASITFHSTEAGSTFACSLDGAAVAPCASPASYTGLADGAHTFSVTATDAVGNVDATPATASWTIDATAPDTIIDSAPSGNVSTTSASITFHSTEAGTTFSCVLDGGASAPCASPASYTGLADGAHTLSVTATDAVGNTAATPATASWSIDATAPDTIIDTAPSGTVPATSASITFHSTEAGSTFKCSIDGAASVTCTSPASYTGLADGAHAFSVAATDAVGNVVATPATASWAVDSTPPDTIIDSAPTGTVSATSATFTFHSTEAGATFLCTLDGSVNTVCSSPATYTGLAEGAHTFSVTATDTTGNVDPTPATTSWTNDSIAPDTIIDSAPSGVIHVATATITFHATEAATFKCSLDGAAPSTCTSPVNYTGLANGAHIFSVTATDTSGNVDATPATAAWTIALAVIDTDADGIPNATDNCPTFPGTAAFNGCDSKMNISFFERHRVGTGNHPQVTKELVANAPIRVFDRAAGSCAQNVGISPANYGTIFSTCPSITQETTDATGAASIGLQASHPWLLIGFDADDGVYSKKAVTLNPGQTKKGKLHVIVTANGHASSAGDDEDTGSVLYTITPEEITWDNAVEPYPFVFESEGDWDVSVTVTPPEGFTADVPALSDTVNSEYKALQFNLTDVGSCWECGFNAQIDLGHKGRKMQHLHKTETPISQSWASQKGLTEKEMKKRGIRVVKPQKGW
jgi:hypothetical protein